MAGRLALIPNHSKTIDSYCRKTNCTSISWRYQNIIDEPIDEVAFILGDPVFWDDLKSLEELAESLVLKHLFIASWTFGTGHAIMCAKESLSGPAVIAYADTLIRADFLDPEADAVIC
jgi:glucose-1-phosphate thymidylyltransferase